MHGTQHGMGAHAYLVVGCFLVSAALPMDAYAARSTIGPIDASNAARCDVSAFDKFADMRAAFRQETAGGNMVEAIVDVRECDFSNQDLSGKVSSGHLCMRACSHAHGHRVSACRPCCTLLENAFAEQQKAWLVGTHACPARPCSG